MTSGEGFELIEMSSDPDQGTVVVPVETPQGVARLHIDVGSGPVRSRGALVLGHGAGGGVEARDLAALARNLPNHGFTVVRVEQPWRVAGRRIAVSPPQLDDAWRFALSGLDRLGIDAGRRVVGGRSAGARVAFRTAAPETASGVLALGFPLHPPGNPERSRIHEIGTATPALIVQGGNDAFGRPGEFSRLPAGVAVAAIPGADHSFLVSKKGPITQREAEELIVDRCLDWLRQLGVRESTARG
jgi:predicted alpha/beta-hydrolase family hydrolase